MTDEETLARALAIPSGYAECKLSMNLHSTQAKVLDTVFAKRKTRTSFLCGNGVGKTSYVLTAAVLYAIEIRDAQVISTSTTFRQITSQLMPNLKHFSHLYPNYTFNESAINVDGIDRYIGFATNEESRFQGYHEYPHRPLLILIDEAAGINEQIFQAVDRCQPTWLLIVGSPLGPEGTFYNIETKPEVYKQYSHFKLTQTDCPWIKKEDIDAMVARWGENHPLVLSSIYAEFATDAEGAIISLASLNKCLNNPPVEEINAMSDMHLGIDFAAGGDKNVMVLVHGNKATIIKSWREKDTMTAAGQIKLELDKLKLNYGLRPSQVTGDASGLGLPIIHRLRELGWPINMFYSQSPPHDEEHYRYRIDEIWLEGAKKIVNCKIILPHDDDLRMELLSRKQRLNSSGKMELEKKVEMKERGVESPDTADALFIAMSKCSYGAPFLAKAVGLSKPRASLAFA